MLENDINNITIWIEILKIFLPTIALLIASLSLYLNYKSNQSRNLLELVKANREIATLRLNNLDILKQVYSENFVYDEATHEEKEFATLLILHFSIVFTLHKRNYLFRIEGFKMDVLDTFSLPLIKNMWKELEKYHNKDFVQYVNNIIATTKDSEPPRD